MVKSFLEAESVIKGSPMWLCLGSHSSKDKSVEPSVGGRVLVKGWNCM